MIKGIPKHNYHPSTPSQFIKPKSYHRHLSVSVPRKVHRQLSSSELDNGQQMDAYKLVFIG